MSVANSLSYLDNVLCELQKQWPGNRIVNLVCHGHSVPAGYFATPFVDTFNSYPHILHRSIKERFPFAVMNVITSAIGGENSMSGSRRFVSDVLRHKPDVVAIDYALNDRGIGLEASEKGWSQMIEAALESGIKVILLTPSWDNSYFKNDENWHKLIKHTEQVRLLAQKYEVGLADAFSAFERYIDKGGGLMDLLSHVNHPNRKGHELIANEIAKYFIAR